MRSAVGWTAFLGQCFASCSSRRHRPATSLALVSRADGRATGRRSPGGWRRETRSECSPRRLGRPPSTVSREVGRHGGRQQSRAAVADAAAWNRARRPQRCRLSQRPALCARVAEKLAADWSPQQIAGWLRRTYPEAREMQVSHETIYRSLFVQSRGVLKQELLRHLRRRKTRCGGPSTPLPSVSPRPDRRCHFDTRAAAQHRGSGRARSLGGRSALRQGELPYRDLGRAALALTSCWSGCGAKTLRASCRRCRDESARCPAG